MRAWLELTKPRITVLILICAAVGYLLGVRGTPELSTLIHVLLGTAMMASGTAALNQWYEADTDAQMRRTRSRPIPSGRVKRGSALLFGVVLSIAGFVDLWMGTNALAACIGALTLLTYILVYTPLKQYSPACTTVGALPGAMPPLIGYCATRGTIDAPALALFLIVFVWQFPHFYSIAWMYREDYARGRIQMLPVVEPDGESTARRVVGCSLLLLPASLAPRFLGMTGSIYAAGAVIAGLALLWSAWRMLRERTFTSARTVLLTSVLYLSVLFTMMVLDRV